MNLRERETAKALEISVQTLRNWRHMRKGPPYIKLGRAIRYRIEDLITYIEKHRVVPEMEVK